ncbi:MAG: hypothetical protein KKB50_19050 [Planctomycetes bacterium]|nr:hypothetical protein [Planctomycetota bacterium]
MSALERAAEDIERGDYGLARRRLHSYLSTKGYDADVLERIGQLCNDMHDPHEAGRFWLVSCAGGERVERAIALFCKQGGSDPKSVVAQLPRFCRQPSLDLYPAPARERLRRLGLAEALTATAREAEEFHTRTSRMKWGGRILVTLLLAVLAFGLVCFVVGASRVFSWLFGS